MSINIIAFAGCAVAACLLAVTVKQYKPELAAGVSIAASAVLLCCLASGIAVIVEKLRQLMGSAGQLNDGLVVVIKAFGICLMTQTAADICRDCGENSIACRVELGGRAAVVIAALPLFADVLSLASELAGV